MSIALAQEKSRPVRRGQWSDKDLTKERLCRITADGLVHSIRIDSTIAIGQFKPLAECRRQKFL